MLHLYHLGSVCLVFSNTSCNHQASQFKFDLLSIHSTMWLVLYPMWGYGLYNCQWSDSIIHLMGRSIACFFIIKLICFDPASTNSSFVLYLKLFIVCFLDNFWWLMQFPISLAGFAYHLQKWLFVVSSFFIWLPHNFNCPFVNVWLTLHHPYFAGNSFSLQGKTFRRFLVLGSYLNSKLNSF